MTLNAARKLPRAKIRRILSVIAKKKANRTDRRAVSLLEKATKDLANYRENQRLAKSARQ